MAGRDSSAAAGCGVLFLVSCLFPLVALLVAIPAMVLVAPAMTAYLLVLAPAQFDRFGLSWLEASAAAPVLALLLVWLASPRSGRLRDRGRGSLGDGRQRSRKVTAAGYLVRAGIMLGATTATGLVTFVRMDLATVMANSVDGQADMGDLATVLGGPAIAATVVMFGIRLWDRRPYPVTVEDVRAATDKAHRTLRQVRADNSELSRLAREVAAKLAAARSETEFVTLRVLHYESFSCADVAHDHYLSARDSLAMMARILGRVRSAPRRWMPPVSRARADRARQYREELSAAAASLQDVHGNLDVEVGRGLELVQSLNANTAVLKGSIRDDCGEPGRRWFEALEQRRETARRDDRRSARAGRS